MNFLMETLFAANKYFNDQEPWNKKNDTNRLNTIIYVSLELIRKISILMYPIIPETSLKALNIFNIKEKDINEMVLAGLNPEEIIMENSYHGLEAVLKIKDWKKI